MSEWRYFLVSDGAEPLELYRCRANGEAVQDQERADIQTFGRDGEWTTAWGGLMNRMLKWFHEQSDEITEEAALQFIRKASDA